MFSPLGNHGPLITPKKEPIYEDDRVSAEFNGKPRTHDIKLQSILPKPMFTGLQKRGRGRGARPSMVPIGNMNPANMCKICGKWFRSRQQVSQHLLVHTDERKHKCTFCDRAFKQASHLQQHQRIHTGEKPYRCPLPGCERAFPQLSNLNHHLRNHDKPEPPASNTCVYCDRVYASETVMKTHIEKMHMTVNGDIKPMIRPDTPSTASTKTPGPSVLYSSGNFVKIAPAPLPSMTVAPPVLNFSQAFLQPYVHELNLVQLSQNLSNHGQLPVDSKMTLPVSIPKMTCDFKDEKGASKSPKGSEKYQQRKNSSENENFSTHDEQRERSLLSESAAKTDIIEDSLSSKLLANHALDQRAINHIIKAANAAKMFDDSNGVSSDSESEPDERFDHELDDCEEMSDDCNFSYTLDGSIQDNRRILGVAKQDKATSENDTQNHSVPNGFGESQTISASPDSSVIDSFPPQQQTRSRKRKAFRPQRVVHDKGFISDDDI